MERLTYWCDDGMGGGEYRVNENGAEYSGHSIDRLAAYEDTGLEPEDLRDYLPMLRTWSQNIGALRYVIELVKAETEGRLLVLPCKAGDTVYLRDLTPCKVLGISIGHYTRTVTIEVNDGNRIPKWQPRGFDEFGVSVFTTREAAEAKLKKVEK